MPPRQVRVTVELMGPFEFDFGATGAEIDVPEPATVGALVEALAAKWPAAVRLRELLCDPSPRGRYCCVSLDHEVLPPEDVLATPLRDGAHVCFALPMAGG